jgi:hypothetical protein
MADSDEPQQTPGLIVADDPERERLRELKVKLGQRRDEIAELDLEIETLRGELWAFESSYQACLTEENQSLRRVERLLVHFERWSELLREVSPDAVPDEAARLEARRARELSDAPPPPPSEAEAKAEPEAGTKANENEGGEGAQGEDASPAPLPSPPGDRLKAAYRALARRYHPDLARTEEERVQMSERMARINALYHDGDLERLEVMAEQAKGGEVDDADAAPGEQLALLTARLEWFDLVLENLDAERTALELTPTCVLFREAETLRKAQSDPLAEIKRGLRTRIEKSYTLVRGAARALESEVKSFNSRGSALGPRQADALEKGFDPFGDKRMVRLGLEELKSLAVPPGTRQLAERLEREGEIRPSVLRLLLFTHIGELSNFPLPGLERFDDISLRLSALARPGEHRATLERALVDADSWVEFGVRQATERIAHLGLRFRTQQARDAMSVMLTSLPIRREFRRVLGVVGERESCPGCSAQVFAVPLFRTHGLDDLRSLVCPRCATSLRSYWMPKGQDVQAVLNDAFLDFELIIEWSFRLGRGSFGVQLLPLQVDELDVGRLRRRVFDDVFQRHQLELKFEELELHQDGAAVGDDVPLGRLASKSFVVRFLSGATIREEESLEVLLHRIRNRFRSGS